MVDVLIDSLIDTAILIPILLAVHLLIELFEVKRMARLRSGKWLKGGLAPLIGTGVGLLPQCGFSVVASELYAGRYIRVGTLVAVFIATSDEALPILFGSAMTDPSVWGKLGALVGIKIVMALAAGYALNLIFRRRELNRDRAEAEHAGEHGCCGHSLNGEEDEHAHGEDGTHGEETEKRREAARIFRTYFKHPLIHTAVITLFVFVVTFALGTLVYFVGEENFRAFMMQNVWLQPLVSAAVGLIPNCAASVMITELFVSGSLTLGAAVGGLAVNAGLGIAVLLKENKNIRANLAIIGGLLVYALAAAYGLTFLGTI